jgi:RNA polymerase sigma-70 factor (ECF subfamily)
MPSALELFERHHRAVFRFLRQWTTSVEEAEDLTQEVFVQVVRSLPRYEERQRERAWVFQIARNLWLDRLRARGRVPPHEPLEARKAPVPAGQGLQVALGQALAGLQDAEREAFLLREVGGLGYGEIARLTGGTEGAVRNRIYRARVALRVSLGGEGGASLGPRQGGRE